MNHSVIDLDIPELRLIARGKVRNIYDFEGNVLVVTTDRVSAFDRPLGIGVPGKAKVLTGLTAFWFGELSDLIGSYMISTDVPCSLGKYGGLLIGRTMLTKRVSFLPVEFVVRGYLYGSAWRDYCENGAVCGLMLKPGMRLGERLPEPIFTPALKVKSGHDVNITEDDCFSAIGAERGRRLKDMSIRIFRRAGCYLESRGIILADTKMEFGILGGQEVLVNEVLTPDCSRLWPGDRYAPGAQQASMDKQPLRDYLRAEGWTGEGPVTAVPDDVLLRMSEDYKEIHRIVTERKDGRDKAGIVAQSGC